LCSEKGIENLFSQLNRNTGPGIRNLNLDASVAVRIHCTNGYFHLTTFWHGLICVENQIDEYLLAEFCVHKRPWQFGRIFPFDFDLCFGPTVMDCLEGLIQNRKDLLRVNLKLQRPGKIQKSAYESIQPAYFSRDEPS